MFDDIVFDSFPHFIGVCFALLLMLLIAGNIVLYIFSSIFVSISIAFENFKIKQYINVPGSLKNKYESVLQQKFPYYNQLSDRSKIKFLIRLNRFIRNKEFESRDDFELTEEVKIMVGATAVQLTFGLESYSLGQFSKFIICPDVFLNSFLNEYHKGETSPRGTVVLSWKHFCEGYEDATDKLNLGLHEMAHALDLSRIYSESDNYFTIYFRKWSMVSEPEFTSMKNHPSFLRDYGGVNFREFFAVCVEHFFEAPAEFKKNLPDIYKHLTILLRQDPLTSIENYEEERNSLRKSYPVEELNAVPRFSSQFSLMTSITNNILLMIRSIFSFVALYLAFRMNNFILLTSILLLIYYFNALLFTRFELMNDYLIIRRPLLFNRFYVFQLDNIISIQFRHHNNDEVELLFLNKGRIDKFNILCSILDRDEDKLLEFLKERNIVSLNALEE